MVLKRLDHVSIGVVDLAKAEAFFCDELGGERLADKGDSVAEGFRWITFMLGGKKIELVSPHQPGEGGVGRYIEKQGEGFHHLSFAAADLAEARAHFELKGIRILGYTDEGSFKHFYLHPRDTFGALIQVFEETEQTLDYAGE